MKSRLLIFGYFLCVSMGYAQHSKRVMSQGEDSAKAKSSYDLIRSLNPEVTSYAHEVMLGIRDQLLMAADGYLNRRGPEYCEHFSFIMTKLSLFKEKLDTMRSVSCYSSSEKEVIDKLILNLHSARNEWPPKLCEKQILTPDDRKAIRDAFKKIANAMKSDWDRGEY